VNIPSWGRGGIRFTGRNLMSLWSAASKTRKFASRVSKGLVGVRAVDGNVRVYSLYGLGFGSDVTIIVRLDG
jgi:hypothetical protein